MSKTEMLVRLQNLHSELSEINLDLIGREQVDAETIDAMEQLVSDVGGLVDRAKDLVQSAKSEDRQVVIDRIQEFEIDHPRISQILTQVTDLLAGIGI